MGKWSKVLPGPTFVVVIDMERSDSQVLPGRMSGNPSLEFGLRFWTPGNVANDGRVKQETGEIRGSVGHWCFVGLVGTIGHWCFVGLVGTIGQRFQLVRGCRKRVTFNGNEIYDLAKRCNIMPITSFGGPRYKLSENQI